MSDRSAWEILGLSDTASEREIKRAYAALAKRYRPEQDPKAFTELREAFEFALAHARWRDRVEAQDATQASEASNESDALPLTSVGSATQENALSLETAVVDELNPEFSQWCALRDEVIAAHASYAEGSGAMNDVELERLIRQWVSHPANDSLAIAASTEQLICALGARYDWPDAIFSFVTRRFEVNTRLAGSTLSNDFWLMMTRQERARDWRAIVEAAKRNDHMPMARLFRPMTWGETMRFWLDAPYRDALRAELHHAKIYFPEQWNQINAKTAARVEDSRAHALPAISLVLLCVMLLSPMLFWFQEVGEARGMLMGARWAAIGVQFLISAAYCLGLVMWVRAGFGSFIFEWGRDGSKTLVLLEILAAAVLVTIALFAKGERATEIGFAQLMMALFFMLRWANIGRIPKPLHRPITPAAIFLDLFIIATIALCMLALFPEILPACLPLVGLVVASAVIYEPPFQWLIDEGKCVTRTGHRVPTYQALLLLLLGAALCGISIGWAVSRWHYGISLADSEFTACSLAIVLSACVYGVPLIETLRGMHEKNAAMTFRVVFGAVWIGSIVFRSFVEARAFLLTALAIGVYALVFGRAFWVTSNFLSVLRGQRTLRP